MQIKLVLHEALCWKWEFLQLGNGLLRKCSRHHFTIGLALRCCWQTSTTCNDMSLGWLDIDMKRNDSVTKRLFLVTWWWNCSCCRIISSTFLSSEQQKVKFQYWRRLDEYFKIKKQRKNICWSLAVKQTNLNCRQTCNLRASSPVGGVARSHARAARERSIIGDLARRPADLESRTQIARQGFL